jgi:F-type H+-transporting ATPase subunit delta
LSSRTAITSGAAGRYAVALFALAEEQSAESEVEADMDRLKELFEGSVEFRQLTESPILDSNQQREGISVVAQELALHKMVRNFLGVLTVNRRLDQLVAAISNFKKLAATKRGEVTATVVSAAALTETQNNDLAAKLKAIVGREVLFETEVNEELLGGLVVRIGSQVVDSSIRTKLENLKLSMKGV